MFFQPVFCLVQIKLSAGPQVEKCKALERSVFPLFTAAAPKLSANSTIFLYSMFLKYLKEFSHLQFFCFGSNKSMSWWTRCISPLVRLGFTQARCQVNQNLSTKAMWELSFCSLVRNHFGQIPSLLCLAKRFEHFTFCLWFFWLLRCAVCVTAQPRTGSGSIQNCTILPKVGADRVWIMFIQQTNCTRVHL